MYPSPLRAWSLLLVSACASSATDTPDDTEPAGETDDTDPGPDTDDDTDPDTDPDTDGDTDTDDGSDAVVVVTCPGDAPTSEDRCDVVAGDTTLRLVGTVLAPDAVYVGGSVQLDADGTITCVGCDCDAPDATTVVCGEAVISPGLINAHEHLTFDDGPVADDGVRYEHRHDWRRGDDERPALAVTGGISADAVRWNELRHLLAGTTTVLGSGGQPGLVRNLDRSSDADALGLTAVELINFPLGDSAGTRRETGCDYGGVLTSPDSVAEAEAVHLHAADGIDSAAAHELDCLTGADDGAEDLLDARFALVSAAALDASHLERLADRGAALVWSPRTNLRLYGATAPIPAARALGVRVALGTDWSVSGSMNLLRELACAADYDDAYLGDTLSDADLWAMVTSVAADVGALDTKLGALEVGRLGDVAIFDASTRSAHAAVTGASSGDVVLVLRAGVALYGDTEIVAALRPDADTCDGLDVCGVPHALCLDADVGRTLDALTAAVGDGAYPLLACTPPVDEPTCTPVRDTTVDGSSTYDGTPTAGDADADGVLDSADTCPDAFDPVRPMDGGTQADVDDDGLGDSCDPCPTTSGPCP